MLIGHELRVSRSQERTRAAEESREAAAERLAKFVETNETIAAQKRQRLEALEKRRQVLIRTSLLDQPQATASDLLQGTADSLAFNVSQAAGVFVGGPGLLGPAHNVHVSFGPRSQGTETPHWMPRPNCTRPPSHNKNTLLETWARHHATCWQVARRI